MYSIVIKENSNSVNPLFIKHFESYDEFLPIQNFCKGSNRVGFLTAMLITVRTHNLKDFCKDFFLPSVVNFALKTDDIVQKIFLVIICAALDICTLIIRIITLIPRYRYNLKHTKADNPLYKYLLQEQVVSKIKNADTIYLEFSYPKNSTTFDFIEIPSYCK